MTLQLLLGVGAAFPQAAGACGVRDGPATT